MSQDDFDTIQSNFKAADFHNGKAKKARNMTGNLFDQRTLDAKVDVSIRRVQSFAPQSGEPLYVAFSGGKDSIVLKEIVRLSGLEFDSHYNVTTVDPPELVAFIREHHPETTFEYPRMSMYQIMCANRAVPTRLVRFCCKELKERGGDGRACVITGVRWAESNRRAARAVIARQCIKREARIVNPVIDWTDADVWEFIHREKLSYPKLYDEGFTRLGCIGCPMAGPSGMAKSFARWPGFLRMYYRAIEKFLPEKIERRRAKGKAISDFVSSPKAFFLWWLRDLTKDKRHERIVSDLIDTYCLRIKSSLTLDVPTDQEPVVNERKSASAANVFTPFRHRPRQEHRPARVE